MKTKQLHKGFSIFTGAALFFVGAVILPAQTQKIAQIEQVGNNNRSYQTQVGDNEASVLQQNVYMNLSEQQQQGWMNKAEIIQSNYSQQNIAVQKQFSLNNRAKIVQENSYNNADQYQEGNNNTGGGGVLYDEMTGYSHTPDHYGAVIVQTGTHCTALQRQFGDYNYNYIRQEGYRQEAEVIQRGSGLSHVLVQESTYIGPKYTITQTSSPLGEFFPRQAMIVHQR